MIAALAFIISACISIILAAVFKSLPVPIIGTIIPYGQPGIIMGIPIICLPPIIL